MAVVSAEIEVDEFTVFINTIKPISAATFAGVLLGLEQHLKKALGEQIDLLLIDIRSGSLFAKFRVDHLSIGFAAASLAFAAAEYFKNAPPPVVFIVLDGEAKAIQIRDQNQSITVTDDQILDAAPGGFINEDPNEELVVKEPTGIRPKPFGLRLKFLFDDKRDALNKALRSGILVVGRFISLGPNTFFETTKGDRYKVVIPDGISPDLPINVPVRARLLSKGHGIVEVISFTLIEP